MIPSDEGQLFGLYGYLILVIFLALVCIVLHLFPDIRARLPWHNSIEATKHANANTATFNTSENIVSQSTNGVQLIHSKKNPTLRKRSIRKLTTTLSSTAKSLSPSSSSTKLSDKSSSFSSSVNSFNSIECCQKLDAILNDVQNECVHDTNLRSVKQKPVANELMMTNKSIVSKDTDTITSTIHEVVKTSNSSGNSTIAKSLKTKKSNPIHHESCKAVVESLSSLTSSSTVPEPLNNSYISTPVPDTSVTPQSLDTTGNDDGEWLCANMKTVRRRRRNNNNKDIKQLTSTDNNDNAHVDDTKLERHVLQQQPIELSSLIVAEENSQNKSNSTHDISSNDQRYLITSQDIINSKTNRNLEPDSSHQSVLECCKNTSSMIENVNSSLRKHSLMDQSVSSTTTNTTATTTSSGNDASLGVLHSNSASTSKRKRRNIPRKKSTDEIIINNDNIESYSILSNENQFDDNNLMLSGTTATTTTTTTPTPINSSMKRNLDKQNDDDESGFELIELSNTSSSVSSAVESDELEMHSSLITTSSTNTTVVEKSLLPQASISPPDLLSHFPPLIKADNGDPISVTMEVELLESGRHPQANKLLKLALSSSNNNNNNSNSQTSNQQEQLTDDLVGGTCSISSRNSNNNDSNKVTTKRSKVRKAD
ncbi:unnamed protein product [Schistosoma haematobium]|uniref:Uncharacterized protein n=1 Tax=Schistosoma haematobium TaxID=6185 RepID=A0A095BWE3_SCHHA|nr:unnamed protein product [Schistosoma haematobium]CAH8621948.1 unnamed protein product [Schistosoma haematobium]